MAQPPRHSWHFLVFSRVPLTSNSDNNKAQRASAGSGVVLSNQELSQSSPSDHLLEMVRLPGKSSPPTDEKTMETKMAGNG
jgi:hypothetical protein